MKHFLSLAALAACAALASLSSVACSSVDPEAYQHTKGPPFGDEGNDFRVVSAVIEQRCGSLDCHGQSGRPMRIFGHYGLRRPEPEDSPNVNDPSQYFTGGKEPTTTAELTDNYQSLCGLEPEILTRLVEKKKGTTPEDLTLVRKPRLLEKHKGGLLWNKGDDGDVCLVNWLTGVKDTSACEQELLHD